MTIRQATLADIPAIAALHAQCFVDAWSEEFLAGILVQPGAVALVTEDGGQIVGFVLVRGGGGEAEILSVGVAPPVRRRGFASGLIRAACLRAEEAGMFDLFLEVSTENTPAQTLYARLGFREAGRRPAYYREGGSVADALVLHRALPL